MKQFLLIVAIFILTVLTSCKQTAKQTITKTDGQKNVSSTTTIKPILVDYKSDTYKISLGDNYKTSEKIIDWSWAALGDEDNKIDSTGKDAFMFIEEPLIHYNDGDWLPSLHIYTDRNIITSFTCNVIFKLEDNPNAIEDFLRLLSRDIKQLKNDNIVKGLRTKGEFKLLETDYNVSYKLIQGKKEYENDWFTYTITTNQKSGR